MVGNRRKTGTMALFAAILTALVILGVLFVTGIQQLLLSETENSLMEVSKQGAGAVASKLDGRLDTLEALAALDEFDINSRNQQQIKEILRQETDRKGFVRMGFANLNGDAFTSDEQILSIADRDYFQKAAKGKANVSSCLMDKLGDHSEIVVFAAPVYHQKELVGVLFATDYTENTVQMIDNMTFAGGSFFIITRDGNIIAQGNHKLTDHAGDFFEMIQSEMTQKDYELFKENIQGGKNGTEEYIFQGVTGLVGHTPIEGTVDWILMVAAPKSVVMDRANQIILRTSVLIGAFILLSGAGAYYLVRLRGRFNKERNISRAALGSSGMHLLRISREGSLLSFDEGFSQKLGLSPAELEGVRLSQLCALDDRQITNDLEKKESFELKLRIKNTSQPLYMRFHRISEDGQREGSYEMMCLDITEQKLRDLEIRKLAYTDQLTGLPNRIFMIDAIRERLGICRVDRSARALVMVDVDHFQMFNNTFGYNVGDKALIELASRLNKEIGLQDTVGRIGGDEFLILLESIGSRRELEEYLSRLGKSLEEPYKLGDNVFLMPCSIGAVIYDETGGGSLADTENLLYSCETAAHKSEEQAHTAYTIFDAVMKQQLQESMEMEQALEQSIERGELMMYYQAQYDVEGQRVAGYESLLRWNSPQYGMVPPSRFVPIAEKCGFIVELGRFVIEQTFAFAKKLEGRECCVSFNASAVELMQSGYTDYVCDCCERFHLKPGSVALEITESCLIESFPEAVQSLRRLKKQGIRVYLDDFGTGYSALNYLKNLPLDSVKVDKSFVDEIVSNSVEKDIVRAITTLSRRLGLKVIAEGVETKQQMDCLFDCGCRYIQGYYISRPVPEEQALALLEGVKFER